MCDAPNILADGTLVGCRLCKQCKNQYINQWAGRCIAESKTANHTYYITLTYGRDEYGDSNHIRAAVLTYSDVQKYMKRIRKTVGKFKYFAVGEYGERNGRAHWHVLLFTEKPLSKKIRYEENYIQEHWKDGWSFFRKFHLSHAYYVCKYIFKDAVDDLKIAKHGMSKKPPIGHQYFQQLAKQYVEQGLAPQDLSYSFSDMRDKQNQPIKYHMKRKTAQNFCASYVTQWQEKHGRSVCINADKCTSSKDWQINWKGLHMPYSDVIEEYMDKLAAEYNDEQKLLNEIKESERKQDEFIKEAKAEARAKAQDQYSRATQKPPRKAAINPTLLCSCADCTSQKKKFHNIQPIQKVEHSTNTTG